MQIARKKDIKQGHYSVREHGIQVVYKEKTFLLNRLDPGSMSGMTTRKAFTLIELLVVVLIIGILATVALPQYTTAVEKARFTEAQQMATRLQKAIDLWLLENGKPTTQVSFLGDNTNASGQLSIDLKNMDCRSEATECLGKNFSYAAMCNPDGSCGTTALRVLNGNRDTVPYAVNWTSNGTTGKWQGDECNYDMDVSPVGEKICKMLEAQGNGFFSCEGC